VAGNTDTGQLDIGPQLPKRRQALEGLMKIERELMRLRREVEEAWLVVDAKDIRRSLRHMDQAVGHLHKGIRKTTHKQRLIHE
jgi:hypothetical protein